MNPRGIFLSSSAEETVTWGEEFSAELSAGDAVFLIGDLGAGKTTLVRGIARGLDYPGSVTSPSFNLIKTYSGRLTIYHCDLYRLNPGDNLAELGIEEMLEGEAIALFEWSERFPLIQQLPRWEVKIEFAPDDHQRLIHWQKFTQGAK